MSHADSSPQTTLEPPGSVSWATAWGLSGVALLLGQAIVRLTPLALEPLRTGLSPLQALLYGAWIAISAYTEGYRAFQKRWVPRVLARAVHLAREPNPLHVALAPFYCMALFHAPRRRLIVSWTAVALILAAVIAVRHLPQPWRGIIDGGVVIGLTWGLVGLALGYARIARGGTIEASAELP